MQIELADCALEVPVDATHNEAGWITWERLAVRWLLQDQMRKVNSWVQKLRICTKCYLKVAYSSICGLLVHQAFSILSKKTSERASAFFPMKDTSWQLGTKFRICTKYHLIVAYSSICGLLVHQAFSILSKKTSERASAFFPMKDTSWKSEVKTWCPEKHPGGPLHSEWTLLEWQHPIASIHTTLYTRLFVFVLVEDKLGQIKKNTSWSSPPPHFFWGGRILFLKTIYYYYFFLIRAFPESNVMLSNMCNRLFHKTILVNTYQIPANLFSVIIRPC